MNKHSRLLSQQKIRLEPVNWTILLFLLLNLHICHKHSKITLINVFINNFILKTKIIYVFYHSEKHYKSWKQGVSLGLFLGKKCHSSS